MASKSEQLRSKELLKQVLKCLKTLITLKENQLQKSEQYKQEIQNIVNQIFNFLVQIFKERGYWNESEAATMERCISAAKEIVVFSLLAHLTFESSWNNPSFHNEIHILAVICAFLEILPTLGHDDIFAIEKTLNKWNQNHKSEITLAEFTIAMIMAIATHDLGNILETVQEEGENPKAIFQKVYRAEGAEERSQAIASVLIKKFDQSVDKAKIQQIIGLVQHLIEQTIFQPNPNLKEKETWWLLVQIIDQIGGNVVLLSTNPNYYVSAVAGLIIEILTVRAANEINLTNFLNFVAFRLNVFIKQDIITQEFAEKVLALLSGNGSSSLNEPKLNQANKNNFAYIVKILEKVFPGRQVIVYTNETNQVSLTISQ